MKQYIVSARKYRPTTFEDVVGQQSITKTLDNAIANNHLAQALLFTGPRGVGKTTCARILAKKINTDEDHTEDEDFAFNIFELDAASNNSVDDIRNLIDQVRIPPQVGSFKVYIIDEVHMLSSAAFNAFLKTLEEPPKHAIFILATTEKHKILPTILSRCQIFDFKRITVTDIKNQLHKVAAQEGINAEDDALHIIAQKADGAMRDALSIFDRVVSFSGKELTRQAVTENLNVLDYSAYFKATQFLLENNIPEALLHFDSLLTKGFDGHHFITGLASHFRDLLVCKVPQTITLLEVGDQVKSLYQEQSQKTSHAFLMEAIELANSCDLKYKNSQNQRLLVELCLMQLASLSYEAEKKKHSNKPFIVPPSYFKVVNNPVTTSSERIPSKELETLSERLEEVNVAAQDGMPNEVSDPRVQKNEVLEDSSPTISKSEEREEIATPILTTPPKNKSKVSALSLKSIQQKQQLKKEIEKNQPAEKEQLKESFTEAEMIDAWEQFAKELKKSGKFNLHSHLTMGVPKLEGTLIHLIYPNETIKVEVEREKGELLQFLRKELKNHQIDLSIEVNETEVKRYAYTPREKFEKLKEKNPLIDSLRKEFDLDV